MFSPPPTSFSPDPSAPAPDEVAHRARVSAASDALAAVEQALQAGDLQRAEAQLLQVLETAPNHRALNLKGVIALRQARAEEAVEAFTRAIAADGTQAHYYGNLAEAYRVLGRVPDAVLCYQRAEQMKPDLARPLLGESRRLADINCAIYHQQVMKSDRYANARRLLGAGFKVYSQNDEDGIIQEIFRRIGTTNQRFIEVGVSPVECNTLLLLLSGWRGVWFDASPLDLRPVEHHWRSGHLKVGQAFVTRENVNQLLRPAEGAEIDLLSIDIDRNDYWVWEALEAVEPRVVVIEYNATFPPPVSVTVEYRANEGWRGTNCYGASLEALARLGRKKGYALVGCNFTGANAFFVRGDLAVGRFAEPFTAENHYEPARFFFQFQAGHRADYGPFVHIPE